jgi:hypothetical protein
MSSVMKKAFQVNKAPSVQVSDSVERQAGPGCAPAQWEPLFAHRRRQVRSRADSPGGRSQFLGISFRVEAATVYGTQHWPLLENKIRTEGRAVNAKLPHIRFLIFLLGDVELHPSVARMPCMCCVPLALLCSHRPHPARCTPPQAMLTARPDPKHRV